MKIEINKNIIIIVIVAILVFGLIIGWAIFQKGKTLPEKEVVPDKVVPEKAFH